MLQVLCGEPHPGTSATGQKGTRCQKCDKVLKRNVKPGLGTEWDHCYICEHVKNLEIEASIIKLLGNNNGLIMPG